MDSRSRTWERILEVLGVMGVGRVLGWIDVSWGTACTSGVFVGIGADIATAGAALGTAVVETGDGVEVVAAPAAPGCKDGFEASVVGRIVCCVTGSAATDSIDFDKRD